MKQHEDIDELVVLLEKLAHVLATDECFAKESKPKPCLWMWQFDNGEWFDDPFPTEEECEDALSECGGQAHPLYPAPPMRSLSDSQLRALILEECRDTSDSNVQDVMTLCRKVEAYFKGSEK